MLDFFRFLLICMLFTLFLFVAYLEVELKNLSNDLKESKDTQWQILK